MYKYLISYGYKNFIKINDKEYDASGTGSMILNSSFKIKTEEDIITTNDNLKKLLSDTIDNIKEINLFSFNLLEGDSND